MKCILGSKIMTSIKEYIKEGEHQKQDFKFRIDDQKKIARTLVAFANTDGGRLLIGVKDNGKIAGINPEEEFHMISGAASLYAQPPVVFESRVWQEDFKLVLEIVVESNLERNHKALDDEGNWKTYIRRGDHTLLANKIVLKIWNFERKGIPKPLKFGVEESKVLSVFQSNEAFTLSKLYRLVALPKQQVDYLVAILVHWKVLIMDLSEEGCFYRLA